LIALLIDRAQLAQVLAHFVDSHLLVCGHHSSG
jgi:hypothetical protein